MSHGSSHLVFKSLKFTVFVGYIMVALHPRESACHVTVVGEDELWIRLLLKRTGEEVEKALRSGHPRKPLDYLLKEAPDERDQM